MSAPNDSTDSFVHITEDSLNQSNNNDNSTAAPDAPITTLPPTAEDPATSGEYDKITAEEAQEAKEEIARAEEPKKEEEVKAAEEPEKKEEEVKAAEEPEKKEEVKAAEEPKKEEPKKEEVKAAEEPKKEEPKKEEPKKEEPKKEEAPTWKSEFSTNSSSNASTPKWKSDFATATPAPTVTTTAAKPTTTSPASTPAAAGAAQVQRQSIVQQRSSAWGQQVSGAQLPTNSGSNSSFANNASNNKSNNNSSVQRGSVSAYNPTFSYSNLSTAQTQTNTYDARSRGTTQGSLAHLMGQSAGVQHKGSFSGLTRARVDKDEERARLEHKNRGANVQLQNSMKTAIAEANDVRAGRAMSTVGSVNYLANKLDKVDQPSGQSAFQKAMAEAKARENTNADGTIKVGEWKE